MDEDLPPADPTSRPTRRWGVIGVVVGLVVVVVLVATGVLERDDAGDDEPAIDQLAEAWRRHRTGTFVVESEWRRTKQADGRSMVSATLLAQRPPDRIQRQFGAVRGQLNGEQVRCSTDPVEGYRCFPSAAPAPDYLAEVDEEVAALRSYATGARPLYAVRATEDGCFELELLVAYPDPPYGRRGELCFDEASGALRYLRRELDGITEEQEAVAIRTEVVDADFDLSADPDYEATGDLPEPDLEDLVGGPGTTR